MRVPLSLSLSLSLSLAACAGVSDPAPATSPTPAPAPAPSPGPALPPPGTTVTAPACGYGGSAPAVSVFVDVTTSTPLTGVTLSFTLADPSTGAPVGRSRAPESLVVSPMERGVLDFSTQGTTPFDGTIPAATPTRLEYFAGLGEDPAHPTPPSAIGGPLRVDVTVHANEGTFTASCATAGMWPSS
jgi:hypothetical protein